MVKFPRRGSGTNGSGGSRSRAIDRQSVRGREAHGGLNVPRARGAYDHRRVMGESQVVGGAFGGV